MPKFRVNMCGRHPCWPSDWSVGKQIELLHCVFSRTSLDNNSPKNLSIYVEIDASSEDEARNRGREIIINEFDLFALCADNPIYLDENYTLTSRV